MSFTSQNYGAKKPARMDRVLLDCLCLEFLFPTAMGLLFYVTGPNILRIYNNHPEVIRCGMECLVIGTIPYCLCGFMDMFPGALRGMGHSTVPMILSVVGTVGSRIIWILYLFPKHRSLTFLFGVYPASWILTIMLQVICFLIVRRKVHQSLRG